jgi:hypothetical protein
MITSTRLVQFNDWRDAKIYCDKNNCKLICAVDDYTFKISETIMTDQILLNNDGVKLFNRCARAGYHKFIANTPIDADFIADADGVLNAAFQAIITALGHDYRRYTVEIAKEQLRKLKLSWTAHGPIICACLRSYWTLVNYSKFLPIHYQKEYKNEMIQDTVDLIVQDDAGNWYICCASLNDKDGPAAINTLPILALDAIVTTCELDFGKYGGIVYRGITRPKIDYLFGETFTDYHSRLCKAGNPRAREIIFDKQGCHPGNIDKMVTDTVTVARAAQQEYYDCKDTTTAQNLSACAIDGYCAYWSQCHDHLFTEQHIENTDDILSIL